MRPCLLMFVAACGFTNSVDGDGVAGDDQQMPPDACVTLSAQLDTCALAIGSALELDGTFEFSTLDGRLVNKSTGMELAVNTATLMTKEDPVQAILAQRVKLAPNTTLRAIGPRGFALIASGTVELGANAVIDVSDNGAGARLAPCAGAPTKGENDSGGAAGGGGAGFGGAGGPGGDGNSDNIISTSAGGNAGVALTTPPLGPRGGCPGAPGGDGDEVGGAGGRGGGAVWIVAANLEIAAGGGINAGGSGGGGGNRTGSQGDAGGGGGGSGGVIWIEALRVRSLGILAANGGGGGEGSGGDASGAIGTAGQLGLSRAAGGTGASASGAAGGAGGHRDGASGLVAANPDPGGGGGGGGGVGFIRVLSLDQQLAMVSPLP